jgi:regulation of enolase protein 1 (concanavalin A-like superfamily)
MGISCIARSTATSPAQLKFLGQYHDLYDQAGLMVRADAQTWMKCGVEFVDGKQNVSVVFTRDFSDWSTARLPEGTGAVWIRVVPQRSCAGHFLFTRWIAMDRVPARLSQSCQ